MRSLLFVSSSIFPLFRDLFSVRKKQEGKNAQDAAVLLALDGPRVQLQRGGGRDHERQAPHGRPLRQGLPGRRVGGLHDDLRGGAEHRERGRALELVTPGCSRWNLSLVQF